MAHPLLPSGSVLWLALAGARQAGDPVEHLIPQLDALLAFTAELDGRLQATGVAGIAGALAIHARVKGALDGVSVADLDARLAAVEALQRELTALAQNLDAVRRLKRFVGG